jgi:hypothetical protein
VDRDRGGVRTPLSSRRPRPLGRGRAFTRGAACDRGGRWRPAAGAGLPPAGKIHLGADADGTRYARRTARRGTGWWRSRPSTIPTNIFHLNLLAGHDAGVGRGVTGAGAKKVVSAQIPLEWSPASPRTVVRRLGVGPRWSLDVPRACLGVSIYPVLSVGLRELT